jgi:hypothetical protein
VLEDKARLSGLLVESRERAEVWIDDEFANDEPAIGLEYSPELTESHTRIRDFTKDPDQVCRIKGTIGIRELSGISLLWLNVSETTFRRSSYQVIKHLPLHIKDIKHTVREERSRDGERMYTYSRSHFKDALSAARLQNVFQTLRRLWASGKQEHPPHAVRHGDRRLATPHPAGQVDAEGKRHTQESPQELAAERRGNGEDPGCEPSKKAQALKTVEAFGRMSY